MRKIFPEKLDQIRDILTETNTGLWLLLGRETMDVSDPALKFVLPVDVMGVSAFFFMPSGRRLALVRRQDVEGLEKMDVFDDVRGYGDNFDSMLRDMIFEIDPNIIDINVDMYDALTDGLTAGLYLRLMKALEGTVYSGRVRRGEAIRHIRGRKIQKEINVMTKCLMELNEACELLNSRLSPGMTEGEVYDFCQSFMKERGLTSSWDNNCCPLVHAGSRAVHAMVRPAGNDIRRGDVFHVSFGAKLDGYATDFQRSWYVLEEGETEAPPEVQRAFDYIVNTIDCVRRRIRPGMQGNEIDAVARGLMAEGGYTYERGCGHTVGMALHDGVVTLGPDNRTLGRLPEMMVEKDYVFTLELFVQTSRGMVAVEEMIRVDDECSEFLYIPQKTLWYIR